MSPQERPDAVPRYARPFVAVFLAAMIAAAVFVWEPWPLTSFRLFSHERIDRQSAWEATAVSTGGGEAGYALGSEDRGLRGFPFVMGEFTGASEERRDEICRVWLAEAPQTEGEPAAAVRIYKRSWLLSERDGDRTEPGTRALEYTCDAGGAHDATP